MGRDRAIRFTVRWAFNRGMPVGPSPEWRTRARYGHPGYGKPTDENLAAYIRKFEESTQPGGCNEQLGPIKVTTAAIIDHETGAEVASYRGA